MARPATSCRTRRGQAGGRDRAAAGVQRHRSLHLELGRPPRRRRALLGPVAFTGRAARAGLTYTRLEVEGDGVAGKRSEGRFGFSRLLLRVRVETDTVDEVHQLAERAEQTCLVSVSLDLPIETMIDVKTAATGQEHNR